MVISPNVSVQSAIQSCIVYQRYQIDSHILMALIPQEVTIKIYLQLYFYTYIQTRSCFKSLWNDENIIKTNRKKSYLAATVLHLSSINASLKSHLLWGSIALREGILRCHQSWQWEILNKSRFKGNNIYKLEKTIGWWFEWPEELINHGCVWTFSTH